MKNITLAVDESVLAAARKYAAARNGSVNSLVRDFLAPIAEREDRARNSRGRIRELSERSPARLGPKTWSRAELHER